MKRVVPAFRNHSSRLQENVGKQVRTADSVWYTDILLKSFPTEFHTYVVDEKFQLFMTSSSEHLLRASVWSLTKKVSKRSRTMYFIVQRQDIIYISECDEIKLLFERFCLLSGAIVVLIQDNIGLQGYTVGTHWNTDTLSCLWNWFPTEFHKYVVDEEFQQFMTSSSEYLLRASLWSLTKYVSKWSRTMYL